MKQPSSFAQYVGLHPLVGFGVLAVDSMLFGGELMTLGVGWAISVPVGLVLALAAILVQRFAWGDSWQAAVGKGLTIGVLTAIPTPIPSILPVAGGIVGLLHSSKAPKALGSKQDTSSAQ